ncbi:unnamed protein product [Rotaria magnacalcarata]|uniref:Uncharacterized protein n=1 Tax=Rotaria magnacalcarata TaxID=392030 RepID=A0A8S2L8K9_9BILA|nr:unnamed protein product [Rotaria magnacalcarata]
MAYFITYDKIRLDRLLTLLNTGDSLAVKRTAATQIGQVVSTNPKEVEPILNKLKKYVIHSSWDVRIACGLAVELISRNISDEFSVLFNSNPRYGLKLNSFNFHNVIANSASFYLGARKIEEIGDYDGNVSVQKKFVRKEFNFGLQERFTGTDLPVEENDFKIESLSSGGSNVKCNRLSWPLNDFYDWLVEQIFQPLWEYRHGSVTILRDLLKGQQSISISNECYYEWLEDLSVRLLTLIILDRFADYVSDEVSYI